MEADVKRELTRLRSENARLRQILKDANIRVPASPDDEKFLRIFIGMGNDVKATAAKLKVKDHTVRSRLERLKRPFELEFVRVEGLWHYKYRVTRRGQKNWLAAVKADPIVAELVYASYDSAHHLSFIPSDFWQSAPPQFRATFDAHRLRARQKRFDEVQASRLELKEWRAKEAAAFEEFQNLSAMRKGLLAAMMADGRSDFSMHKALAWIAGSDEYFYVGYEIERSLEVSMPGLQGLHIPTALTLFEAGVTCAEDIASVPPDNLLAMLGGRTAQFRKLDWWLKRRGLSMMPPQNKTSKKKTGAEAPA